MSYRYRNPNRKRTPVCRATGLPIEQSSILLSEPVALCPVCQRFVKVKRDGTLRRHRGTPKAMLPSEQQFRLPFQYHDGGRREAGFKGRAPGDCVPRAIAIATGRPYREVYDELFKLQGSTPRRGVLRVFWQKYLEGQGWKYVTPAAMAMRADQLPKGTLILHVHRHLVTVIDHTIYDTYDCSKGGTRQVLGYMMKEEAN